MSKPTLADLSPRHQAEALAQLAKSVPKPEAITTKKRLRQRTDKRSALEDRFENFLKRGERFGHIYEQFPLRIGSGCNYYLDFLCIRYEEMWFEEKRFLAAVFHGFEVKGPYARAAGIIKLKAGASLYPWIKFELVSWINNTWQFEEVCR